MSIEELNQGFSMSKYMKKADRDLAMLNTIKAQREYIERLEELAVAFRQTIETIGSTKEDIGLTNHILSVIDNALASKPKDI